MTDVQVLFCASLGPKVVEQAEYLLRFVYHETLISTIKSLQIGKKTCLKKVGQIHAKQVLAVLGCLVRPLHSLHSLEEKISYFEFSLILL